MARFTMPREFYIPKGSVKVSDKQSDAVAYLYQGTRHAGAGGGVYYGAAIFFGKQAKPWSHVTYGTPERREKDVTAAFESRRKTLEWRGGVKTERKAKAAAFAKEIEVGDIFHYSFGYDETHHVFYEVTEVKGRFAMVRQIAQAQRDLGYDWRHECMPQSGAFIGEPVRVLIQDGLIKVDRHYHATKWNTGRVAGVPIGPKYTGGGCH